MDKRNTSAVWATMYVVVLHVGTIDLCSQFLDPFLQQYEGLLRSTKEKFKYSKIIFSGLLPCHDGFFLQDKATIFNVHVHVAKLCMEFTDCKFIDHSEVLDGHHHFA